MMKRNYLRFSRIAFLMGGLIVLSLSSAAPNRFASAGQSRGGEIIAKPTPSRPAPKPNPSGEKTKPLPAKFTNQYRMEFVLIPAGKFMMGSTDGADAEKPIHSVTIGRALYLGRYEVAQYQWRAAMGRTVAEQKRLVDQNGELRRRLAGEGDEYPMYYVSWQETQAFLQRLNALGDGYTYRLPSEAEWEYACRAGASEDRPSDLYAMAWYKTNSGDSTQPVGMRRANAFGLYDMLGNVWEWCEDWATSNYGGAPTDGSAWMTPGDLKERSLRGGSFHTGNLAFLRCSARSGETPDYRDFETGFRVVAEKR
jgi:eukaryotic-like serine/threonine-protein kinase